MLENHVPSRELCQKWKSVGGRQDTEFYWRDSLEGYPAFVFQVSTTPSAYASDCAAPLASEMMEWAEARDKNKKTVHRLTLKKYDDGTYGIAYPDAYGVAEQDWNGILPNTLMQMCISRKEEEGGCHKK